MGNVTRFFDPEGFDRAARIEARIRAGVASEHDCEELPALYDEEGRTDGASTARRRHCP